MHRAARFLAIPLLLAVVAPVPPSAASEPAEVAAVKRLLKTGDPSTRASALRRLAGTTGRAAARLLVDALEDPHPYVRRAAAGVIAASPHDDEPRARARTASDLRRLGSPIARVEACRVFALWADDQGRLALGKALEDSSTGVRAAAVRWLADPRVGFATGPSEEAQAVRAAIGARLEDSDGLVRALALDALASWPTAEPPSPRHLGDTDPRVRFSALESSVAGASRSDRANPGADGSPAVVAVLHGLDDAVWSVRLLAAELSRTVPQRRILSALVGALADERLRVREAAHRSLVALTGIPFDPEARVWQGWLDGDGATFDPALGPVGGTPGGTGKGPSEPSVAGRTLARPRFLGLPLVSRHVGFVLDASSSMRRRLPDGTSRWDQARRELDDAVTRLAEKPARVNVFVFRDEVEAVFDRAVVPTRARRAALAKALAAVRPGGRTALFDGLAAALEDPDLDSVILLSDGAPSAGAFFTKTDLMEEVRRLNRWRRARIDVIAVGADRTAARWRDALRKLAEETGGLFVRR